VWLDSEEFDKLRDSVRHMAEEKIKPRAADIDVSGEFPWDVKEELARLNLFALPFPESLGGIREDHRVRLCIAVEEIARVCASSSLILQVQDLGAQPILLAGTEELKSRYCPPLASGEKLCAFAITEPEAGSDIGALLTTAELKGDYYVINGCKRFISNGSVADFLVVFAKTDPTEGYKGLSAFIVESDSPGFSVSRHENKMGIRGSPAAEIVFEDCRVPKQNLLGREGEGFKLAMRTFDRTRPIIAAQAVGIARGALDEAVTYASERKQFGRRIVDFQGIQFLLAERAAELEAARALVYYSAWLADHGSEQLAYYASAAKLIASDTAMRVTTDAVQVAGGTGYLRDFSFERKMRDAKITQIYEGTNQIQRLVIARQLLKGGIPT
jgi:alkylation response protein AidB-like acyl-CoA dehydrogenase